MIVTGRHIADAEARIREHILETPLLHSDEFSQRCHARIWLKLENRQHTGSFKARGAMNKILSLAEQDPDSRMVITASTGNHGQGVARALQITGQRGEIYIPESAPEIKINALRRYPTEIIVHGKDSLEAELHAKQVARKRDAVWVSPYNDPQIIAGQGTIGIELTRQLQDIRAVYVTVGGGGLISGIATWFAENSPQTEIIGCLPANSPEMKLSVEAGRVIHLDAPKPTLSDGSAGGLEDDSITFPICKALVSRYLLVPESEIASAIRETWRAHGERIEGAAGVAVAAMLKDAHGYSGQNVVVIICGGNIDEEKFQSILAHPFSDA